jgi:hypothetical protein
VNYLASFFHSLSVSHIRYRIFGRLLNSKSFKKHVENEPTKESPECKEEKTHYHNRWNGRQDDLDKQHHHTAIAG